MAKVCSSAPLVGDDGQHVGDGLPGGRVLMLGAVEVKGSTSALPMARSGGEGQHVGVDGDNMPQGFPVWWR